MPLTFDLLARPSDSFAAVFEIYRLVIARSEQKTEAELRAAFQRPDYRVVVAREGGAIIGFSLAWVPAGEAFWLLEYLAVDTRHQGGGIGALLFNETRARVGGEHIALVEADDDAGAPPGAIQRRRLGFYGRLGCRRLAGISYQLPLTANGTPPPMLLLALAPAAMTAIPRETTRAWLTRIYGEVYVQRADDPRIAAMLAGLPDDIALSPASSPATPQ